jgi:hypothetical protein
VALSLFLFLFCRNRFLALFFWDGSLTCNHYRQQLLDFQRESHEERAHLLRAGL